MPDGIPTVFTYDDRGLVTATVVGDTPGEILTTTTVYDPVTGDRVASTDPHGATTTWEHDAAGRVVRVVPPAGNLPDADPNDHASTFTYNDAGLLLTTTDALERTVVNSYDAVGRLATTTDAGGRTLAYTYDAAGNLTAVAGPEPSRPPIVTVYDGLNRPIEITDPAGRTATRRYDARSQLVEVADPTGTATLTYTDAGQVATSTDQAGRTTTFSYDAFGQPTGVRYPDDTTVAYGYDPFGRLTETLDATGTTTYSYDDAGRPVQIVTPHGPFGYSYDSLGRLTSRTTPDGSTETRTYDGSNLAAVTLDGATVATYHYDPIGVPTGLTLTNGVTETVTYDTVGRVDTLEAHDPAGDLLHRASYTYDVYGRPTAIDDEHSSQAFTYDHADRLTRVCFDRNACDGTETDWIAYSYDTAGNRATEQRGRSETATLALTGTETSAGGTWTATITAATDPATDGTELAYSYQSERGITGAGTCTTDPSGICPFEEVTLPNNDKSLTATVTALDQTTTSGPSIVVERGGGSVATEPVAGPNHTIETSRTYSHDDAGRLTAVHLDEGSGPVLDTDFDYDQVGNTTRAGDTHHSWDAAGRLTSTTSDDTTTAYHYDARGLRVAATTPTGDTTYTWDPLGAGLVATTVDDGTSQTVTRYLPGRHGQQVDGTRSYFHTDPTRTLQTISDDTGSLAASYDYEPFGTLRSVRDHTGQPTPDTAHDPHTTLGFHGHHHDPGGLIYMQARYHDPATGRFLSADPAGGGYTYGFNNPIVYIDPDGLWGWSAIGDHASSVASVAGFVAVGAVATAVVIGAPLTAPLLVGTLWASGAIAFGGEVINAASVCGAGKGGCGTAVATAGLAAVAGNTVRPLRAIHQAKRATATITPHTPAPRGLQAGDEVFHYTQRQFVESIQQSGLRSGSYATPSGNLRPLQAHVELSLPPNTPFRDAVLRVDVAGLRQAGYEIPGVTRVSNVVRGPGGRVYTMPGGGYELNFPYAIPPEFIKVVR